MRIDVLLAVAGVLGLIGCGGTSSPSAMGPPTNAFTGTLSITSALPTGTTTCLATHTVSFTAAGANLHTVSAAGGECLAFTNNDTVNHQPASNGAVACPQLDDSVSLTPGQTFTTTPLGGPMTCYWKDLLNPPTTGGPGY